MIRAALILASAEFQEGLRNRWVLSAMLLLTTLAFTLAMLGSSPIGETRVSALTVTTVSLASLSVYLIPLLALTLTYDAIVGERERGTLLLLLTYPVTRSQVIGGKFLGHLAIIAAAIVVGYGCTGVYIGINNETSSAEWLLFSTMMASSMVLGSVFIALGFLISVMVVSRATAAGTAIAIWLFLVVLYDLILLGIVLSSPLESFSANLFGAFMLLNPADVYRLFNLAGSEAASLVSGSAGVLESSFLTPEILAISLFLWIILPLLTSIWVFKRHEL